jgi:hypothetical protein
MYFGEVILTHGFIRYYMELNDLSHFQAASLFLGDDS